jgi:hypothetical protein
MISFFLNMKKPVKIYRSLKILKRKKEKKKKDGGNIMKLN